MLPCGRRFIAAPRERGGRGAAINTHGTLRDGSVFDSSPAPVAFQLNAVIPCFSEGLQMMKIGGKRKLTCPPNLAYGDRGPPPRILAGATLVLEAQLLEIVPTPGAMSTP